MSKIICDVCGTVFPETAAQCPICGCAKSPMAQAVNQEDAQQKSENAGGYTYVKGGRFSKSNVRRSAAGIAPERQAAPQQRRTPGERRTPKEQPEAGNKGLIAVVAILLVAIVIVAVYIGVNVFLSDLGGKPDTDGTNAPNPSVSDPTDNAGISCTEIKLGALTVEFQNETDKLLLAPEVLPADTTDKLLFSSENPAVATVDQNGLILPVAHGQTVITVTCGNVTAQCTVICSFGEPEPTEAPTDAIPTAPAGFVLELQTYKGSGEITISEYGASHQLFKEKDGVKASDILWTSSDPSIAIVENGKVTGLSRGKCTITAQIGDQVAECLVRCSFDAPEETEPAPYNISTDDVTLNSQSKSFTLTLRNADMSNVQDVEWTASLEGYLEIDGNKITCVNFTEKKVVTVSTTIDGHTYSCVVRITPDDASNNG